MSTRADDLKQLKKDHATVMEKVQSIQRAYTAYNEEVVSSIKDILVAAGVYDEVHQLEMDRAEAQKDANDKLKVLQGQIEDMQKMAKFLVEREPALAQLLDPQPGSVNPVVVESAPVEAVAVESTPVVETVLEPEVVKEIVPGPVKPVIQAAPAESGVVADIPVPDAKTAAPKAKRPSKPSF